MSQRPRVHVYIKNEAAFKNLEIEVKSFWYKRYGESLTNSEMIIVALEYLKDGLTGRGDSKPNDIKGQNIYKYCRTGIQS